MADQLGNLSPEEYAQQQQINRQQKMAEMLMSQNQQPQGQMVSGRFVAPSFFQNLQPVANMLTGAYLAKQGDTRTAALAEAIRGRNTKELQDVVQTMKGTPAQAGNLPLQGTTQAIGSIEEPVGEYKAPVAGIAGNKDLALMKALKSTSPIAANIANTLITEMVKPPEEFNLNEGQKRFRKGINGESIEIASGGGKAHVVGNSLIVDGKEVYKGQDKPVQIDTGTEIRFVEPLTGKVIYSTPKHHVFAPHANQIIDTPNGMIEYNPNNRSFNPVMVNGQPVMGTKGNLPEGATSQVTGVQNVKSALSDLKTRINTFKPQDMLNPNTRALMSTDYQNVVLQLKEAMKLGVLNGNDYQILTSMITNPNDPKAFLVNKETQMQQINNLNKKLDDMTKNVYKSHQRTMSSNLENVNAPIYIVNKTTGERQMSNDGGKTWSPVK